MDTMILTKYKKLIFYAVLSLIVIWCLKGLWHLNDKSDVKLTTVKDLEVENNLHESLRLFSESKANEKEIMHLKEQVKKLELECNRPDLSKFSDSLPIIYAVTPTYARPVQKAELTRLSHTLRLVPNLHWIIVEDSKEKTKIVSDLLKSSGIKFTQLNAETPKDWKLKAKEPRWVKPRGVLQRNTALDWIRQNIKVTEQDGVLYFADDDNSYTLEIFEEMRYIKKVGVWPVGLVGGLKVERPKLNSEGKVVGWLTAWSPERPFAIDMAGFGININRFLQKTDAKFAFEVEKGYQESELLKHLVDSLDELEPRAHNCTKILVWHTRTEAPSLRQEDLLRKKGKQPSDLGLEV